MKMLIEQNSTGGENMLLVIRPDLENQDRPIKKRIRSCHGKRDFICGCGKAYLSYPAIYTHVRNKHEGEFPKNSQHVQDGKVVGLYNTSHKVNNPHRFYSSQDARSGFSESLATAVDDIKFLLKRLNFTMEGNEVVHFLTS